MTNVARKLGQLSLHSKSGSPTKQNNTSTTGQHIRTNQDSEAVSDKFENCDLEKGSECYELGEVNRQTSEEEAPESDNGYFDLLPVSKHFYASDFLRLIF